jgi:uncharacterized membrane protein
MKPYQWVLVAGFIFGLIACCLDDLLRILGVL